MNITEHRKNLDKLPPLFQRQRELISKVTPHDQTLRTTLESCASKSEDNIFRVLIMGGFSAGKSSFINALLGEHLLPSFMLPTTAIITEVCYGEEKKVEVYPKKGKWRGGDKPFEIRPSLDEIAKYCTIDNEGNVNTRNEENSNVIESPFEKMVIYWPLSLLKDGVMLIDSPGTNDPYNSDRIVKEYIPKADAMIYVMNGTAAYKNTDKQDLEAVNSFCRSIILVTSYFDMVPPAEREQFVRYVKKNTLGFTDLGEEAIHFVASLDALAAKKTGDKEKLIASGYDGLQSYLARYLTENKGRDQIKTTTDGMRFVNSQLQRDITSQIRTATSGRTTLVDKIRAAQDKLAAAKREGKLLSQNFKLELDLGRIPEKAGQLAGELCDDLPNHVSLENFTPNTSLPSGLGKLNPMATKRASDAIVEECGQYIKNALEAHVNSWTSDTLRPAVDVEVKRAVKAVQSDMDVFNATLDQIDVNLQGDINVDTGTGAGGYLSGLIYGLFTGDWLTALMGPAYGAGNMGRAIAFQFGAGLLVGIAALFAPITYPVLILASLGASILAILTSDGDKKLNKLKKKVEDEYRKSLTSDTTQKDKVKANVHDSIKKFMDDLAQKFTDAVNSDISSKEQSIQNTIDQINTDEASLARRVTELEDAAKQIDNINCSINELRGLYGITE